MTWGKFILEEAEHDLTHLDPFTVLVAPSVAGAPSYRVLVSFSHHAFTRKLADGDNPNRHFGPAGDVRCFCDDRLLLSRDLPDIVRRSVNGKAYFPSRAHPKQRNFLFVESKGEPYLIAFNLSLAKATGIDVAMFVVSAHARPDFRKRDHDTIRFPTLVSKTARGERIVRPPYPRK